MTNQEIEQLTTSDCFQIYEYYTNWVQYSNGDHKTFIQMKEELKKLKTAFLKNKCMKLYWNLKEHWGFYFNED